MIRKVYELDQMICPHCGGYTRIIAFITEYDVATNPEKIEMMEKISQAKTVKLRYNGLKGFHRVHDHKKTKRAMKDVLDAYKELTGLK